MTYIDVNNVFSFFHHLSNGQLQQATLMFPPHSCSSTQPLTHESAEGIPDAVEAVFGVVSGEEDEGEHLREGRRQVQVVRCVQQITLLEFR